MALQLHICVLLGLYVGVVESSIYENVTVVAGRTLTLSCPFNFTTSDHLEWKNPSNFLIFFNQQKVLKGSRFRLVSFSNSESTISLSNVKFKDGGYYTCLEYSNPVKTKLFKVTVVGRPKLEVDEHDDKTLIKCSAEANFSPPKMYWLFESGLEIEAQPRVHCDSIKFSLEDMLLVRSYKRRTIVKCVVRHAALYDSYLINFVAIGKNPTEEPQLISTPAYVPSTGTSKEQLTESVPGTQFITNNETAVLVTTESSLANITTDNTITTEESLNGKEARRREKRSPLLIFLVTCLIVALMVVMIFFGIKLRKQCVLWKKENEDTDQSLESSKSKSSHEERQSQEKKGHALHNTYTKYVGETAVEESSSRTAAEESSSRAAAEESKQQQQNREKEAMEESLQVPNGHTSEIQVTVETHEPEAISPIKETEI
ncbi:cytotoxic and regulatory T-cell molecule [Brienomyrus brachyistius]|uniref:cytotoxic and regulatory T-cell molecule n=1 Tax=Brienomyrus brachyistius TaxID=42636 RepID=UPI0020B3BF00|nr:cytotoxic and regulatory T-cell molecule [Brienomyrus brachyistius]